MRQGAGETLVQFALEAYREALTTCKDNIKANIN